MNVEKTVEILNNLITQAIWHGADLGGSYNQNGENLTESIENVIEYFGLDGYTAGKIECNEFGFYGIGIVKKVD